MMTATPPQLDTNNGRNGAAIEVPFSPPAETPGASPSKNSPNKGGAQRGNRNRLRHGLCGFQLPKDAKHVQHKLNQFRRELEDVVLSQRGEVGVKDAALIQSAQRHERRARLAETWLRREWDELGTQDRLGILKEVSAATDSRDKCIDRLELEREKPEFRNAIARLVGDLDE